MKLPQIYNIVKVGNPMATMPGQLMATMVDWSSNRIWWFLKPGTPKLWLVFYCK